MRCLPGSLPKPRTRYINCKNLFMVCDKPYGNGLPNYPPSYVTMDLYVPMLIARYLLIVKAQYSWHY